MPGNPVLAAVFSSRSLSRACCNPLRVDFHACGPSSITIRIPRMPHRRFRRPASTSACTGTGSPPWHDLRDDLAGNGCPWGGPLLHYNDPQIGPTPESKFHAEDSHAPTLGPVPKPGKPVAARFCLGYTGLVRIPAQGTCVPKRCDGKSTPVPNEKKQCPS